MKRMSDARFRSLLSMAAFLERQRPMTASQRRQYQRVMAKLDQVRVMIRRDQ